MNERWHTIWNCRGTNGDRALLLDDLIALNGFDTGLTAIRSAEWRSNAQRIAAALGIQAGDKVFEIGCGSGAFLVALQEFAACEVAGADYSEGLIDVARKVFPEHSFEVVAAVNMDTSASCDHAVSHSMFHYLTLAEASTVIERMLTKATRTVGIFDLPDLATRDSAEVMRRDNLPAGEYDKKYAGLSHTYYDKAWLRAEVSRLCKDASVEFISSQIDNNAQTPFRFGMIVRKNLAKGMIANRERHIP
jgi:cyclopropane fatty-acyl-phospholipid synthase-like methyltransferase